MSKEKSIEQQIDESIENLSNADSSDCLANFYRNAAKKANKK